MTTPLRVLIVEDTPDDAELMVLRLVQEGFQPDWRRVETEADYLAALETHPDLVLADWSLPQFSGLRALKLMRERGLDTPFVIVSGSIGEEAAVDALRQGASDYVLKDRPGRLGPAVRQALEEKSLREERKRAEQALQVERDNLRAMMSSAPVALLVLDEREQVIDANPAAQSLFGRSLVELKRHRCGDFLGCVDRHNDPGGCGETPSCPACTLNVAIKDVLRGGERVHDRETEIVLETRMGNERCWLRFSIEPVTLDGQTRFIMALHDITKRKRAKEALRQSEEQYRILVENASEAIFVAQDGKLRFVNGRSQEITGYTREELTSRAFIEFVHPDDRELLMDRHIKRQQGVDLPSRYSFRIVHATGETRWMELSAVRIEWAGRPATLNFMSDITERKLAEDEREKLQAQFLQAQKMESVGRLAGGVAHDFNNMLGIILGYAEMAMNQVDPAERLHDNLLEIRNAAQRSADLVRQLLAFARKQTIRPRVLDLNDTVTGMLKILQRLIGEDIQLVWKPGLDLWPVKMDPSQLDQVLANLSVNARDAIDGVGTLTIETENVVLDESYCQTSLDCVPGEYVLLALSDSGAGMDAAVLEHLFEPFFTTKEVGKGTGLGLATVYGIVKQNNGVINVYSEPGLGTTVKIYLPRAQAAAAATAEVAPAMPVGGTETVLLVEDEEAMLQLAAAVLQRFGYTVLSAQTPGAGLDLAAGHQGPIHLLITDVVMPEMDGKQLQSRLTALRPGLKTLFMSGYTGNVIVHRGILPDDVHFLQKPFSVNSLAEKVREVLDKGERMKNERSQ